MFRIIKHVSNDDYPSSYLVTKYVYCLVSKVTADSEAVCYCTFMFILRLRCNWCCCGLVTKLYPTLLDYMDWSPPGSPVHEISQARILEWVATSFSRLPRDLTVPGTEPASPALAVRFFTTEPPGKPIIGIHHYINLRGTE